MVICAVVAGCFGAIVGSPTLRVRGDYLAIVTLAFGEIFTRVAQNNIGGLTGGANAIPNIPQVELFGTAFNESIIIGAIRLPSGVLYYVLIVLLVAFVMLVFAHLKDSRLGRAWIAIREDEDAAGAMGVRTGPIKILAFGASILFILPEKLREFADYRLLLFGLGLIVLMRLRPQGLIADKHRKAELAGEPEPVLAAEEPEEVGVTT
jgi:branched-chain amino acid transport system permease protein